MSAIPISDLNPVDGFQCDHCGFAGVVCVFAVDDETEEPDTDTQCEFVPKRCPNCGKELFANAE